MRTYTELSGLEQAGAINYHHNTLVENIIGGKMSLTPELQDTLDIAILECEPWHAVASIPDVCMEVIGFMAVQNALKGTYEDKAPLPLGTLDIIYGTIADRAHFGKTLRISIIPLDKKPSCVMME